MAATSSISGIVSGLQTDDIISKIMEYARQPQTRLQTRQAEAQSKLAVWQSLNTRVLALKMQADSIADAADFQAMTAASSNQDIVTASADTTAAPGTYYITVTSRAQAHQIGSQSGAYTSLNDIVGTGTVSIALANDTSFEVELDSNNNTLAGLRDAVNKANKGVKATIVNAGTSDAPDYRLVFTSTSTGTQNRILSVTTDLSGGTAPVFNLDSPIQAASDATVVLGEGAGQISVTQSTNTITGLIPGVTLNVASADAGELVRINVTQNTSAIKSSIQGFVSQYNDLVDAIGEQFDYNPDTGTSGVLMGDYLLQNMQMQMDSTVSGIVSGLSSKYMALSQVGITFDTGGYLVIDDTKLSNALANYPDDVTKLFSTNLDSDSSYISLVASTSDTQPSGSAGWDVEVTQAARRAQVTAGTAMSDVLDADESLTVNSVTIDLTTGMDIDDVIAAINAHSSETNASATRTGADGTGSGDYLTIRRVQYGESYTLSVWSSRSRSAGDTTGFGSQLVTAEDPAGEDDLGQGMLGLNVAGTINGEAAIGKGQILYLDSDSTNTAKGLSLLITASSPLSSANVKFTKGVGTAMRDLLIGMTGTSGILTTAQAGVNTEIETLQKSIDDMESRLTDQEERLYAQFNAMEAQLAKLQDQGNFISAQVSAMNKSK